MTCGNYDYCKKALKKRYELESKTELYVAEFQLRKRNKDEDWATLGDELKPSFEWLPKSDQ